MSRYWQQQQQQQQQRKCKCNCTTKKVLLPSGGGGRGVIPPLCVQTRTAERTPLFPRIFFAFKKQFLKCWWQKSIDQTVYQIWKRGPGKACLRCTRSMDLKSHCCHTHRCRFNLMLLTCQFCHGGRDQPRTTEMNRMSIVFFFALFFLCFSKENGNTLSAFIWKICTFVEDFYKYTFCITTRLCQCKTDRPPPTPSKSVQICSLLSSPEEQF